MDFQQTRSFSPNSVSPIIWRIGLKSWLIRPIYEVFVKLMISHVFLFFFLQCFPSSKPLKSLSDLLHEYNLPPGLFPQNIICYEFDETKGTLIVYLPSACELSFRESSALRYAT